VSPEERRAVLAEVARRHRQRLDADVARRREKSRESFRWFVEAAWPQVEPRTFVPGRHIDVLCDFLQTYYDEGGGEDAVVNIPPGTGKSLICTVLWPAWIWVARDPGHRSICTSYADNATRRDAIRCRNLVQSQWWQEAWPEIQIPFQNTHAAADWSTTTGGWRISVPLGGQMTSRHGDAVIIDDPIKPEDARLGRAQLVEVQRIIDETVPTRLLSPSTSHRLVVMQRLHERDPAGALLSRGARRLVLPMLFEVESADLLDWRTGEGELLWPEFRSEDDVRVLSSKMSDYAIAGQLQQRPVPLGGGIFKEEWFVNRWTTRPRHDVGTWIQSWDCTFKGETTSHYVVGTVWCLTPEGDYCLVHVERGRMDFVETVDAVRRVTRLFPQARTKLVENKANGPAVKSALDREIDGIVLVEPQGGKEARAHAVTYICRAGQVVLPASAPWVPEYVDEVTAFPFGLDDDQVDSTTQAIVFLADTRDDSFTRAMQSARGELHGVRKAG
jgi:predicted phage terminase large subunit-like protein